MSYCYQTPRSVPSTMPENAELRKTVIQGSLGVIGMSYRSLRLINAGADINHAVNEDRDTMLHQASTSILVHHLCGYGADIDRRNIHGKTPLHVAAETGKPSKVIQALIDHCANVNARDKCGNTPLNYAVRRINRDYEVIKMLLNNGSIIAEECASSNWNTTGRSPLKDAFLVDDTKCVEILIKFLLLHSIAREPHGQILAEYWRHRKYQKMKKFYENCCSELSKMGREVINKQTRVKLLSIIRGRVSLVDIVSCDPAAEDTFTNRCFWLARSLKYPIYNDVLLAKLEKFLDKRCLIKQAREMEVYTRVDLVQNVDMKAVEDNEGSKVIDCANAEKIRHGPQKIIPSNPNKIVGFNTDLPRAKVDQAIKVGLQLNLEGAYKLSSDFIEKRPRHQKNQESRQKNQPQNIYLNDDILNSAYNVRSQGKVNSKEQFFSYKGKVIIPYDLSQYKAEADCSQNDGLCENLNQNNAYDHRAEQQKQVNSGKAVLEYENNSIIPKEFHEKRKKPQRVVLDDTINLDNAFDFRKELHQKMQTLKAILDSEADAIVPYDLGSEFVEKGSPPQKAVLDEKPVCDISEHLEEVDESQENTEDKPYKKIILHEDMVVHIAGYLDKKDLFNWIVAYYVPDATEKENEEEYSIEWWRRRIMKRVRENSSGQGAFKFRKHQI